CRRVCPSGKTQCCPTHHHAGQGEHASSGSPGPSRRESPQSRNSSLRTEQQCPGHALAPPGSSKCAIGGRGSVPVSALEPGGLALAPLFPASLLAARGFGTQGGVQSRRGVLPHPGFPGAVSMVGCRNRNEEGASL